MAISKTYDPKEVEGKWYQYWLDQKIFASKPDDREPFTVVIPPPNVTGVLHMGHILNNTIQDVLIRKARMEGKNACWVPGTDHASIATEAKVVRMLREKGIKKSDLGRDEFLKHAWAWKEEYGGKILHQLHQLGCSCDWDRTGFTMDEVRSEAVIDTFIRLYQKGFIYRGLRMVNWDPEGKTVLSKEEVIYKDVNSKLYHINYKIVGEEGVATIATTRPETILGDTAICINPKDTRYTHLHGKKVYVPLIDREIPVILDSYVTMEFGTGCLKVTPAHDENDYELGKKHHLETIDILNDDGTLNEKAQLYIGEDRFVVRKKIAKELEEKGYLAKVEDYQNQVGTSERTGAVIEPKLSLQWFIDMKEISKPALEKVMDDTIEFHPKSFKNMYRSWMDNVQDWCISRQLWWGHRIPAYYLPDGDFVVAKTAEEALKLAQEKDADITLRDLKQDEDVLDTWASSWLWPISLFNGIAEPDNEEIGYYYPTSVLVTGFDIIFFWVARMIIAGYEWRGEMPFKHVYFTGMVRDQFGRKMSKSLGNSPNVFKLMEKYSTDGVRYGILSASAAGNDLKFDSDVPKSNKPEDVATFSQQEPHSMLCETGRNFTNKIWNALRLVKSWEVDESLDSKENQIAIDWFSAKFQEALKDIEAGYQNFRISESMVSIYKLIWDEFCAYYLEMIKPDYDREAGKSMPIDASTLEATLNFLEDLMKLLHPFMPFITEEVWQELAERKEGESISTSTYPTIQGFDKTILEKANIAFEVIQNINNIRNQKQLKKSQRIELFLISKDAELYTTQFGNYIKKLAGLSKIEVVTDKLEGANSFIVKGNEFFIPLEEEVNAEEELAKLQKELEYQKGFLNTVNKKLSNERFVNNAPEKVVESEKKKKADAETKIKTLEEAIAGLSK